MFPGTLRSISFWRWALALLFSSILIALGWLSALTAVQAPWLGLRAEAVADRAIIMWVQPAGLGWDAGIRPGDFVTALDGRPASPRDAAAVSTASQVQVRSALGNSHTASTTVAGTQLLPVATWSFRLIAVCFMVIGMLIFLLTAELRVAWSVLGLTLTIAITLLAAPATTVGAPWALAAIFYGLLGFGASTFVLFLFFPVNHLNTIAGRGLLVGCLGVNSALLIGYAWVVAFDSAAYAGLRQLFSALLGAELLGACALIGIAFLRPRIAHPGTHHVLGVLLLGTLGAVIPFCLFILGPFLLGQAPLAPPEIAILSVVLLPLSLGIAILRGQIVAIEPLAYRGLVALVVWIGLVGAYSFLFTLLGLLIGTLSTMSANSAQFLPLQIAIIAGTFPLLQHRLRHRLEYLLFHDVYPYDDTLLHLSTSIVQHTAVATIASYVLEQLGQLMGLRWVVLRLYNDTKPGELDIDQAEHYQWGELALPFEPSSAAPSAGASASQGAPAIQEADVWPIDLVAGGTSIGLLLLGPKRHGGGFTRRDTTFLATLVPLIAMALYNALLICRLQNQVSVLKERERVLAAMTTKLMGVQEEERRRIALDLHDDALQRVMLLERELAEANATPPVYRWRKSAEDITAAIRAVCLGLHPPVLDDLGLVASVEWLVNDLRACTDLSVDFEAQPSDQGSFGRLGPALETALYRVAQEALTNCRKHAQANRVIVQLQRDPAEVTLRVIDDGRGFDPTAMQGASALQLGILGMRERLRPWPSIIKVERGVPCGTTVFASVALQSRRVDV